MRRLLVKFYKKGEAALLSHRETMRAMERALRRSGVPLAFTSGYHPHPKVSYSPALPLGVAAEAEYLEVAVEGNVDPEDALVRMNASLPPGLGVVSVEILPPSMPRLSRWTRYGLYRVEAGDTILHLCLRLSGEGGGRLKDALRRLEEETGLDLEGSRITRAGIFASREEVLEEAPRPVYFYRGSDDSLERADEEQGPAGQ